MAFLEAFGSSSAALSIEKDNPGTAAFNSHTRHSFAAWRYYFDPRDGEIPQDTGRYHSFYEEPRVEVVEIRPDPLKRYQLVLRLTGWAANQPVRFRELPRHLLILISWKQIFKWMIFPH